MSQRLALCAVLLLLGGCYDSSWGQAKQSQQSVAQARTPQTLHGTTDEEPRASALAARERTLHIRAHATPRHVAEISDWQRRLADTLDDANRVLVPTLAVRLELGEASVMQTSAPDDDLARVLDELAASDPGNDVDWVLGLTGSVPRFEVSFQKLGMARLSSKHLVVRAINDASELDAIERGFPDLEASERTKLFLARKRHKRSAVLLHELGHTLGSPHQIDPRSIMSSRYDIAEESYGQDVAELLRITLEDRQLPEGQRNPRAVAEASLGVFTRTADHWVAAERDAERKNLEAQRDANTSRPTAPSAPAAGVVDPSLAPLSAAHRAAYDRALAWKKQDRFAEAWAEASPLFAAYPDVAPVQELRCALGTKLHDWSVAKTECAALLPSGGQKGQRGKK